MLLKEVARVIRVEMRTRMGVWGFHVETMSHKNLWASNLVRFDVAKMI